MEKKVLLVADDVEMNRKIISRFLSEEYEVLEATNGIEAWDLIKNSHVDIALLDIIMPELDGLTLISKIRSDPELPDIGILVATSTKEKTERAALEKGADDIVSKPYDTVVIRKRLENILAQKRLKQAITMVNQASEAKNSFLSNMSHDMRTPLNAIINLTNMALEELDRPKELREDLEKISLSGEFLLGLVNDVLDMAKIESGKVELSPAVYSSNSFVKYINGIISPLCEKKNMKFRFEKELPNINLFVDRVRFNQIFFNLLSNAIKYTPDSGTVTFEIKCGEIQEGFVPCVFVVSDNGIGMSREFQKNLYKPFMREDNSEAYTGTGLGLSITKTIVDKMGGQIYIKSEKGKGTEVTVNLLLPVASSEQELHEAKGADSFVGGTDEIKKICSGKRVLVVEDHPLNREILCRILKKTGIAIESAVNGKEGVEMFNAHGSGYYQLVLMDIRMPVMDGLEATRQIRNSKHSDAGTIPIIAMTANAYNDDMALSVQAGMNEHLTKPVVPEQLFSAMCKLMKEQDTTLRPKVLVVDDIEANAAVVELALQKSYRTIVAYNGIQALEILKKERDIVAVVTDIQMPEMDGKELIKEIRSNIHYKNIAILASTQYGDAEQEEELLTDGADDFVYKPTTPGILLARMDNILARRRMDY